LFAESQGAVMRNFPLFQAATVANLLVVTGMAHAHGIAGNRYFDGAAISRIHFRGCARLRSPGRSLTKNLLPDFEGGA